ncbi:MAG: hypothetical protein CENE_02696 [Candidatus Celerinatantimonas neptuna]|nr:MAG: hypothetical protein CENE_02696 [Candidatus Celerinatantimonas neptuna]
MISIDRRRHEKWLTYGLLKVARISPYLQVLMLAGLAALLVFPLFQSAPRYHWQTPWNNSQLFSEWVLWGIWYPGTLLSVLLVGRFWCGMLCPLGAMSEWFSRLGVSCSFPKFLRHPLATALSFTWVTIWAQTLDVRDDLHSALLLFSIIFALAMGCGLMFGSRVGQKRRVWCRHLCPIGSVLGVFSRLGILNVATKKTSLSAGELVEGYREQGLCPTSIELRSKQTSRHCIKCARCVKPHSRGGLHIELRDFGHEIVAIDHHAPCLTELLFIFLAPGLAVAGFVWSSSPLFVGFRQSLGHFALAHGWYGWLQQGPMWLMDQNSALGQHYLWLDFISIGAFMIGMALLLALPLAGLSVLGGMLFQRIKRKPWLTCISEFGYQFAPLAMLCILLGLGSTLFGSLKEAMGQSVMAIELGLLGLALLFNLSSAYRYLKVNSLPLKEALLCALLWVCGGVLLIMATLWSIFPGWSFVWIGL